MRDTPDATEADNPDANCVNHPDAMDTDDSDSDTNTGEIAVDEPDVPEGLAEHSIEFESRFTDTAVIEPFPFGNPGAPIPGATQGPTLYDSDSNWAPFKSRRDWKIAHWAKTEKTTSSAVDRLLPVIEVSAAMLITLL